MRNYFSTLASALVLFTVTLSSCSDKDYYIGYEVDKLNDISTAYIYPYAGEDHDATIEITIETDGNVNLNDVECEIPHLKYNKSWLFMITQDDCKHAAFSTTWAAIHNKPLSPKYYYDYLHLKFGDMPPDAARLGYPLTYSDGAGNDVRFSFSTTLEPESDWMNAKTDVDLVGLLTNNSRFRMKSGLTWRNVAEMLNYDVGIAFHDVNTESVNNVDSLIKHLGISQDIILSKLRGRGCKIMAEPNENKTYVRAAWQYKPIQGLNAQNTKEGIEVKTIKPFQQGNNDLEGVVQQRYFLEPLTAQHKISDVLALKREEREAVHLGLHGTDINWVRLLDWVYKNYGNSESGDDSVWMPSFEEFYEYNYYRVHAVIRKNIEGNTLKVTIPLVAGQYFYYPSITLNLKGLDKAHVKSVKSNDVVTGLSYGNYMINDNDIYENGFMLNVDCRKGLKERAKHYVDEYHEGYDESIKDDARYFINKMKDSDEKEILMKQVE